MQRPTRRFAMRLALALGRCDVDEMLSELTAGQLTEWEAFFMLEPWGESVQNYRFAALSSLLANIFRTERSKPYGLEDFLLRSTVERELHAELHADEEQSKLKELFKTLMP